MSKSKIAIFTILGLIGLIGFLITISWYRFDLRVTAPVAYKVGIENTWYQEVSMNEYFDVDKVTIAEIEKKLLRQGFVPTSPSSGLKSHGFHSKDGVLKFYRFAVADNEVFFVREYMIASGLCSQTAAVAISESDGKITNIRGLNPGGTCV